VLPEDKGSPKNKFAFSGVEAREGRIASYLTDEQRSHAGWIDA
jgi:hypothetical protein